MADKVIGADIPKTCGVCGDFVSEFSLCCAGYFERRVEGKHTSPPRWCPIREAQRAKEVGD